jgi:hypothetical protein
MEMEILMKKKHLFLQVVFFLYSFSFSTILYNLSDHKIHASIIFTSLNTDAQSVAKLQWVCTSLTGFESPEQDLISSELNLTNAEVFSHIELPGLLILLFFYI